MSNARFGLRTRTGEVSNIVQNTSALDYLLNDYTNAAAAYSLRILSSTYTGSAIRVRRASDNAEQDIGFDANGDLDTSSLATFCSGTNGFVTTWYDQSGNSNNATQATAGNQPKVVDAGVLVTENGNPAIDFNGSSNELTSPSTITNEFVSIFGVFKTEKSTGNQYLFGVTNETSGTRRASWISGTNYYSSGFISNLLISAISTNTQYLGVNFFDNDLNQISGAINGSYVSPSSLTLNNLSSPIIAIGNGGTFTEYHDGKIQEVIIYDSDQSANRTGIETNINDYYAIY